MKNTFKRIVAILLTLVILASFAAISASADVQLYNKNKRGSASYVSQLFAFRGTTDKQLNNNAATQNMKYSADCFVVVPTANSNKKYQADINYGTGEDKIAMGMKFSSNSADAITYMYATVGVNGAAGPITTTVNSASVTVNPVGGYDVIKDPYSSEESTEFFDYINLNDEENSSANKVYLYYSKDEAAGDPITGVYLDIRDTALTEYTGTDKNYVKTADGTIANFNSGSTGSYVYMYYVTTAYSPLAGSVFSSSAIWVIVCGVAVIGIATVATVVAVKNKKKKAQ